MSISFSNLQQSPNHCRTSNISLKFILQKYLDSKKNISLKKLNLDHLVNVISIYWFYIPLSSQSRYCFIIPTPQPRPLRLNYTFNRVTFLNLTRALLLGESQISDRLAEMKVRDMTRGRDLIAFLFDVEENPIPA